MSRRTVFVALVLLAAVQLAVPLQMIRKRQHALENGTLVRFRTAPVDPYDAFRGLYVALAMSESTVIVRDAASYHPGQRIYVLLETDAQGFARPSDVTRRRPSAGTHVECRVASVSYPRQIQIRYPFDRYYMNEALAPDAERAYREHSGRGERDAYVAVRIEEGFAVLEELYVDGLPIGELVGSGE